MVRGRVDLLVMLGSLLILLVQLSPAPARTAQPAPPTARVVGEVSVVWREFHPGVRQAAPSLTTVRLCAAALTRGDRTSALVLRFCDAQPTTPQRRYALGYDDLTVRADLPGGGTLEYDLLEFVPSSYGAASFSQGPIGGNTVPVVRAFVRDVTDVVFVIPRELPLGLPTIRVSGRYAGQDFDQTERFVPLGPDLERTERERVRWAPTWATARY